MNNTAVEIKGALDFIPSDIARDDWVKVLTAIKSCLGEGGFLIADSWSRSASDQYSASDLKHTWKSLKLGSVNAGTIFHLARKNGFKFKSMTVDERAEFKARLREAKRLGEEIARSEEEKRERLNQKAAIKAEHTWGSAGAVDSEHTYFKRKRLNKYIHAYEFIKQRGNDLILPLLDGEGSLKNIQTINIFGVKKFLYGGKVKGCFCPIGEVGKVIYICEGYATGRTLHQITEEAVFCAMFAGNLKAVALATRKAYPDIKIIIAADNDRFTRQNTGLIKAKEAALAVDGEYIYPKFKDGQKGTDFNDLAILEGDI